MKERGVKVSVFKMGLHDCAAIGMVSSLLRLACNRVRMQSRERMNDLLELG